MQFSNKCIMNYQDFLFSFWNILKHNLMKDSQEFWMIRETQKKQLLNRQLQQKDKETKFKCFKELNPKKKTR